MAGESILAVDDDPASLELVRALLEAEGYRVRPASGGEQALRLMAQAPADLVCTDLSMPGMDGLALLAEVRRRHPATGVVVFSGVGDDEKVVLCLEGGALDYVHKPFTRKQFAATVRDALSRRDSAPGMDVRHEMPGWFELTADSEFETVERFRNCVQRLAERRASPEVAEDLRFAIDELGRNAVEWGNLGIKGRRVRFSYCLLEEKVLFKIEDEGEGFHLAGVPDPIAHPEKVLEIREAQGKRVGGFGIHLVRKLMDEVIYNEKGNVVILAKYLRTP